jgi:hypothetical protein
MHFGALPTYDLDAQLPEQTIRDITKAYASADTGPLGSGLLSHYFPTTGERWDIGPVPQWIAVYLLSMDPAAKQAMLGTAIAAGAVPIHVRSDKTGFPLTMTERPLVRIMHQNQGGPDIFPPSEYGETPWAADDAHQPEMTFVPYLVTGDYFFLEELSFWASWNLMMFAPPDNAPPGLRRFVDGEQIRGQAWSLRTLGRAAYILPDDYPLKKYFISNLDYNLQYWIDKYVNDPNSAIAKLGVADGPYPKERTPPWQQDFLSMVMVNLAEMGFEKAKKLLPWRANMTSARQILGEGCHAVLNRWDIWFRESNDAPVITDWTQLIALNLKKQPNVNGTCPNEWSTTGVQTFAAVAALAGTDIPVARRAYEQLKAANVPGTGAQTPAMVKWALAPGTVLRH